MRYAAIDVGSNAVRLLIVDIMENENKVSYKKNTFIRVPLRLGDDAFLEKNISTRKQTDLLKAMSAFKNLMDVYKVEEYMACATSAMREARNGSEIVDRIRNEAGIELEIVQGQREANIIYANGIGDSLDRKKNYLYIDVGGGSTELSIFSDGKPQASRSFDIGTIRILDNQDKDETWKDLKEWIKDNCKDFKNMSGIGTGGNINKLFRMSEVKDDLPMTITKLNSLYTYLSSFSLKERINVLNLKNDRADVIIPACEIYLSVMKWAGVTKIYVPKVGMADGIIQILIQKNFKE